MNAACIFLVLALAQPRPDWDVFLTKLESTNHRDGKALLDLGLWCEESKLPSGAALCYGKAIKLGDSGTNEAPFVESSFRLARIEVETGKHEKAYARLRELLGKHSHEEARRLLQKAETNQTREQLQHFEKGNEHLAKGVHKKAAESFEQAYKLIPAQASGAAFIPRPVILAKLAECRARIDDEYYQAHVKQERSMQPCPTCASTPTPGFVTCSKCAGKGQWTVRRYSRLRGYYYITVICGGQNDTGKGCGGRGYLGCGGCVGIGQVSKVITPAEREALFKVVNRVRHPQIFQRPLDGALKVVQDVLLDVKEGSTLNYLRSIAHDYALSKDLRKALGEMPPTVDNLRKASPTWNAPQNGDRGKVNFLLCYACEYSGYLRHFEMLRGVRKPNLRVTDWSSFMSGEALSPELLSAFPDEGKAEWRAVKGFLADADKGKLQEYKFKDLLEVQGAIPHDVNFFVWRDTAKPRLEELGRGEWREFIGELASGYPFEIGEKIRKVPREHQVVLVGRFLRNRLGHPRNWFEVWHFQVGLSRAQEEIYRALSERIDEISFPGIPISRVAQFLREWRDLSVRFDGVSDKTVIQCEARACSLGLLVDAIARSALRCGWYHEKARLVFSRKVPAQAARDLAAVLAELRKAGPGEIKVGVAAERREVAVLPDDPAGLRVVASEEMREMRYDRAEACLEKLQGILPPGETAGESVAARKAVSRLLQMARLFGELTGKTPVSHLVGAPELMEVIYRKPTGEFVPSRTVSVLRKDPGAWLVQEAYGVRFTVDPTKFPREPRPIPAAEWRARKEEELRRLEGQLEKASPDSRPSRLFLLAIFAKTHGFAAKGTEYLKRATELPEFEFFLATHAPEKYELLVGIWKEATGRRAAEVASAAPEPEPASPKEPRPSSPGEPKIAMAPVEPFPEGLSGAELMARVREYTRQGHACYQMILEGQNAGEWRKQAQACFREAEKGARMLLESQPDDPNAQKLLAGITQMERDILKDIGFFD